jgi:CRISPR type III-A-associated protein Csm2
MAQTIIEMVENGIQELAPLESLARDLVKNDVKTNQIRKLFGAIRQIEAKGFGKEGNDTVVDVKMLEPRLAYAYGKASGKSKIGLEILYNNLKTPIQRIGNDEKKFKNFVKTMEAIVAYHKANGGQD